MLFSYWLYLKNTLNNLNHKFEICCGNLMKRNLKCDISHFIDPTNKFLEIFSFQSNGPQPGMFRYAEYLISLLETVASRVDISLWSPICLEHVETHHFLHFSPSLFLANRFIMQIKRPLQRWKRVSSSEWGLENT